MDKNDTNKQNSTLVNTVIKGGYFNVTPKPSEPIMTNGSWGTAMPTITPPYEKKKEQNKSTNFPQALLRDKQK